MAGGAWRVRHGSGQDRGLVDTPQTWHTVEWRFNCSSTDTANDGIWQMWFDGVEQTPPAAATTPKVPTQSVDQASTADSLITVAQSGFNMLTVFDNLAGVSNQWDTNEGGYWLNDVVISRNRIGHTYQPSDDGSTPVDLTNVKTYTGW
jgi:hypothetical protein